MYCILKKLINETPNYSSCHLTKQKRLPFPNSDSVSISAFELLYLDIWGRVLSIYQPMMGSIISLPLWMILLGCIC